MATALEHIRDFHGRRVEPLTDLERAVVAEFEVDTSGARLAVRTSDEGPRFFADIRDTLAVGLRPFVHTNSENLTTSGLGRGQHTHIGRHIGVTVNAEGRLSGCGCGASVSLKRGEKSSHFDKI